MPPSFSSKRSFLPSRVRVFLKPMLLLSLLPEVATQPSSAVSLHLGSGSSAGASWAAAGAAPAQATATNTAVTRLRRFMVSDSYVMVMVPSGLRAAAEAAFLRGLGDRLAALRAFLGRR